MASAKQPSTEESVHFVDQEKWEEAMELFEEKEYGEAASSFSELLQQRSEELGERAAECADVAYYYGLSMFHHGKRLSGKEILGAATKEVILRKAETKAAEEEREEQAGEGSSKGENVADEKSETAVEGEDEEEEESPEECFETAFSVLELARQIYNEQLKKTASPMDYKHVQKKVINVHSILAEMAAENDEFTEAMTEYERVLKMQQEGDYEARKIADTHMQIALSLILDEKAHRARFHFQRAAEKLEALEKELTEKQADVSDIIKDLKERIEEMKQEHQQQIAHGGIETKASASGSSASQITSSSSSSTLSSKNQSLSSDVNVLSVRRKKRTHDETQEEGPETANGKRVKTD